MRRKKIQCWYHSQNEQKDSATWGIKPRKSKKAKPKNTKQTLEVCSSWMRWRVFQNLKVLWSWFDILGTCWYYMFTLERLIYSQMESWIIARAILLLASNENEISVLEKSIKWWQGKHFPEFFMFNFSLKLNAFPSNGEKLS